MESISLEKLKSIFKAVKAQIAEVLRELRYVKVDYSKREDSKEGNSTRDETSTSKLKQNMNFEVTEKKAPKKATMNFIDSFIREVKKFTTKIINNEYTSSYLDTRDEKAQKKFEDFKRKIIENNNKWCEFKLPKTDGCPHKTCNIKFFHEEIILQQLPFKDAVEFFFFTINPKKFCQRFKLCCKLGMHAKERDIVNCIYCHNQILTLKEIIYKLFDKQLNTNSHNEEAQNPLIIGVTRSLSEIGGNSHIEPIPKKKKKMIDFDYLDVDVSNFTFEDIIENSKARTFLSIVESTVLSTGDLINNEENVEGMFIIRLLSDRPYAVEELKKHFINSPKEFKALKHPEKRKKKIPWKIRHSLFLYRPYVRKALKILYGPLLDKEILKKTPDKEINNYFMNLCDIFCGLRCCENLKHTLKCCEFWEKISMILNFSINFWLPLGDEGFDNQDEIILESNDYFNGVGSHRTASQNSPDLQNSIKNLEASPIVEHDKD